MDASGYLRSHPTLQKGTYRIKVNPYCHISVLGVFLIFFNPPKTKLTFYYVLICNLQRIISYLIENTLCFLYKDHFIVTVWRNIAVYCDNHVELLSTVRE